MKHLTILGVLLVILGATACSSKQKPLVPLALGESGGKPQALTLTEQGTQAYHAKQFEDARRYFEQAVVAAPESGQAHYNYGLALNALGDAEDARQHFLEAANLAPGDKTIWDSPALAPYGDPDSKTRTKGRPYGTKRPTFCAACMGR
ncbi:MAG TPA: tetratricopeptide repeat protein [Nitrospira sp.]|nr:tetratricopeptide repeat protein [Nitrospira sp.]